MRRCGRWTGVILLWIGSVLPVLVRAQEPLTPAIKPAAPLVDASLTTFDPTDMQVPRMMALPAEPPSVYAPVEPERPIDGTNKGGVNIDLNFRYLTDDVYRGVSHNLAVYNSSAPNTVNRHASNFQTDAKLEFNLGKLPHPFVGVFVNINDADPVSRFQEIRPFAGLDYSLRPINLSAGVNAYIYPEREKNRPSPNTSEAFLRFSLDDSYFFRSQNPLIAPYVMGAYDYDKNRGWYVEAGIKHDFEFPDFGITLSPYGDVAWVSHFPQQFITVSTHSSGFQHYDIGLIGDLSLNHMLHLLPRYGQFAIEGYITYTSKFSNRILGNTEVWGGVGLKYRY